jgi:hypothetical protein
MWRNGRSFFTRVPTLAVLVLMSLTQPAFAQGLAVSVDRTVTGANTASAQEQTVQGYPQGCYYDEYQDCDRDGRHGRGDRGRGDHGRGGGGGGRGGRR